MTTTILATAASFTDDGYATVLGFADNSANPVNYVTLDMTNEPDDQDLALGLDGVHIEAGALPINGYDLVEDILATETGVAIRLKPGAARNAGISPLIDVRLESKTIDGITVGEAVQPFKKRLFRAELR